MKTLRMFHRGGILVPTVLLTDCWTERMRGLLGRTGLEQGTGMLFRSCSSIHTVGMRFAIDVMYFDQENRVVRVVPALKPNRISYGGFRARSALELQSGWLDLTLLPKDEKVSFREKQDEENRIGKHVDCPERRPDNGD